jgi:hypothetical protein
LAVIVPEWRGTQLLANYRKHAVFETHGRQVPTGDGVCLAPGHRR